jgi:hypothetical protein
VNSPLSFLEQIAEQRIDEAMARGDFDRLPGLGKPLQLDDDSHIPPELRVAYRILKNAGMVPPEVELRRDIASAEGLLLAATSHEEREAAGRKLEYLLTRLSMSRRGLRNLLLESEYREQLARKLKPKESP